MSAAGIRIIACQTVINELKELSPRAVSVCQAIDPGLHSRPQKLKEALQAAIDAIDGVNDPIVLGFGLCAQAVIGLQACSSTLVIPRVDDCIAIFLGSGEAYKRHLKAQPGTYFLSPGWIDAGTTLIDELKTLVARYGPERAKRIQHEMLKHYKRLVFIDMGSGDCKNHKRFSREAAAELELSYEEIKGTGRMLSMMIEGPWESPEFVIVRPGEPIRLLEFLK